MAESLPARHDRGVEHVCADRQDEMMDRHLDDTVAPMTKVFSQISLRSSSGVPGSMVRS